MTDGTKDLIRSKLLHLMKDLDYIKTLDIDQFTIMRLSLIYSLSESITKHLH